MALAHKRAVIAVVLVSSAIGIWALSAPSSDDVARAPIAEPVSRFGQGFGQSSSPSLTAKAKGPPLVVADGETYDVADFWQWAGSESLGRDDIDRLGLSSQDVTELVCQFADFIDLARLGLKAQNAAEWQPQVWRSSLAAAAYLSIVNPPDDRIDTEETKLARLSAAIGTPANEEAQENRLHDYALQRGLDAHPDTLSRYRWTLLREAARRGQVDIGRTRNDSTVQNATDQTAADVPAQGSSRPQCKARPGMDVATAQTNSFAQQQSFQQTIRGRLRASSTLSITAQSIMN